MLGRFLGRLLPVAPRPTRHYARRGPGPLVKETLHANARGSRRARRTRRRPRSHEPRRPERRRELEALPPEALRDPEALEQGAGLPNQGPAADAGVRLPVQ